MIQSTVELSGSQKDGLHKAPDIFEHVNYGLFFRSDSKNIAFQLFQTEQTTAYATLLYMIIGSFYFMASRLAFVLYFPSWFATFNIIVAVFGIMLTGWTIVFIKFNPTSILRQYSSYIECVWYFSVVASFVLGVAMKAYNGVCDDDERSLFARFGCNTTNREISEGYMSLCLLFPTILTLVMTGITWNNKLLSWVCSCVGCCVIIYHYEYYDSRILFFMLAPFSGATLYFNQIQQLKLYLLHEQQLLLLEENKELARVDHVSEMRHLIGNVAHDMKTPIAGFLSGIETITSLTKDVLYGGSDVTPKSPLKRQPQDSLSYPEVAGKLQCVLSTVDSILHIHAFFLMTINRCIDFAKASNGDTLIPRLETVDLREVFSQPVRCMSEMQDSVRIRAEELPDTLCTHITTDKQWLLENLLCLLSNAARYSEKGTEVSIRVTLRGEMPNARRQQSLGTHNSLNNHTNSTDLKGSRSTDSPITVPKKRFSFITNGARVSADRYSQSSVRSDESRVTTVDDLEAGLNTTAASQQHESSSTLNSDPRDRERERESKEHWLHFAVEDTGVGIPSDLIESMFNPSFTQAHRQSGGTGLGLYSLAKRIEALGGDYGVHKKSAEDETDKEKGVQSAQSRGSVFWFTIPYRPDRRAAAQEETARQYERQQREKQEVSAREAINKQGEAPSLRKPPTAASVTRALSFGTSFSGSQLALSHPRAATNLSAVLGMTMSGRQKSSSSPLNILLVDDSLPILKMCGMLFRKQGHKVTTAENGQEALDRLEEESSLHTATMSAHFDVILMDLQMPVMDGLEATGRIRDAERAYAAKTALLQNDMVVDEIEAPSPYTRRGLARVDTAHFRREDHPHLLIIGVSACDDNDTIQGAFSAGIDAFIPKPCTIKSFNDTYDKHHKRLLEACEGFDSGD